MTALVTPVWLHPLFAAGSFPGNRPLRFPQSYLPVRPAQWAARIAPLAAANPRRATAAAIRRANVHDRARNA